MATELELGARMPRYMQEEDYRIELLIWILIEAFKPRGYVDPDSLHKTTIRYKRELEKRGVEFTIYPDLITERTRDVDDAAVRAMEYGLIGLQYGNSGHAPVYGGVDRFLKRPRHGNPSLTDEEVRLAKEAASESFDAFDENKLNDDLKNGETPAATK